MKRQETKLYIATYDDKTASHTLFWTGTDWVIGVGNAKEFSTQRAARSEGEQAIGIANLSFANLKIRTLRRTIGNCVECGAAFGHMEGCSHVLDAMRLNALLNGKAVTL